LQASGSTARRAKATRRMRTLADGVGVRIVVDGDGGDKATGMARYAP
jgi:hypothetical protein